MSLPGFLFVLLIVIMLWRLGARSATVTNDPTLAPERAPAAAVPIPKPAPLARAYHTLRRWFFSRPVAIQEVAIRPRVEHNAIELRFYVPRRVLQVEILVSISQAASFREAEFVAATGESRVMGHAVTARKKDDVRILIATPRVEPTTRILVRFRTLEQPVQYRIRVRSRKPVDEDLPHLRQGLARFEAGDFAGALAALRTYGAFSAENPWALLCMARSLASMGDSPQGKELAIQALVRGLPDEATDDYRQMARRDWYTASAHHNALREACGQWTLDDQHGAVVLEVSRDYQLGFNGWYLRRVREICQVRRAVAARMLTRIGFAFTDQEHVLFSACRVIQPDGRSLDLPAEHFVVTDSPERNISIVTGAEKAGHWLLPELSEGDRIEWCYHLLSREFQTVGDEKQHRMMLTEMGHPFFPTYRGIVTIRVRQDKPLHIRLRPEPSRITREDKSDGDWKTTTFTLRKHLPVHHTNFPQERYFYNPVAAFACADCAWSTAVRLSLAHNFGDLEVDDSLPPSLLRHLEGRETKAEALRQVFYWIRDRLKYAAVGSATGLIGQSGRAEAIVRSGVADCKDRAYLLSLACRELALPCQLVAVSAKHGILFRDLPAEQCDHVFVKVRLDDRWIYLDAADSQTVFGSCPPRFQGLECVILDANGTIEDLPVECADANCLEVVEDFDRVQDGWLGGSFHLRAQGNIARLVDEHWKRRSLEALGRVQSAQAVLRVFLPSLVLSAFQRTSHTADSDRFEVNGEHQRCPLSFLGNRQVGTLSWRDPIIPIDMWRSLRFDRAFVLHFPVTLRFRVRFAERVAPRVAGLSDPYALSNALCTISDERTRSASELAIRREIVFKKKFVGQDELHLVPPSMEGIEKALQLALILGD